MTSNELAIIIAFYLSKFNKEALKNLGFSKDAEAFEAIAEILRIKKNYIKFRRDEFDAIHPWRKGWQRPLDIRTKNAIEALQDLSEFELREISLSILQSADFRESEDANKIISLFSDHKNSGISKKFIVRGPTGKKAEEYFIKHHHIHKLPIDGSLNDTRELGIGCDFTIELDDIRYYIEVKGLSEIEGGILFTSKEWELAKKEGNAYFLIIVSDINNSPVINFIQNPFSKLSAKRNVIRTVQINWSVSKNELNQAISVY